MIERPKEEGVVWLSGVRQMRNGNRSGTGLRGTCCCHGGSDKFYFTAEITLHKPHSCQPSGKHSY